MPYFERPVCVIDSYPPYVGWCSVNVSRGMLESRADPESPYHDKSFSKDKTIILYCASGGRSALAGKVLKDMGYDRVYNLGAFKDWAENGGPLE